MNLPGIAQISSLLGAPKYAPKSPKNRFWELLATIWHRFGAARSNLDGFWTPWARFFIDLAFIFEWIERGFCKQSLDEQYALVAALNMALLLSHCIFSLTSGAAGCASRLRRPRRVHGVLDPKRKEAKKSKLQRDIHYLRRMDSTWMDFSSSAKL